MDPLTQILMQKQMGQPQQPMPLSGMPPPPPPTGSSSPSQFLPIPDEKAGPWGPAVGQGVGASLAPTLAPSNAPPSTPPNPAPKVPQQAQRFQNAQQLEGAYRNNWQPNPMLLRAQQTR